MSDLFHKLVPDAFIKQVARVMQMADWHTYQVLTKRADRLRDFLNDELGFASHSDHIWWGVSVEDREYGLPRIEALRGAPAAVRFLSIEPLLEDIGEIALDGIHWVIVGGESGHGARPIQESWVLDIKRQCEAAGVPFFFKQWGGVHKSKAGRLLEGRTFDDMPPRIARSVPPAKARRSLIAEVSGWKIEANTEEERELLKTSC